MTNNLEDFEQPDLEPGGESPQGRGIKANLSHAWRTRPLFKLLVLMIAVGAIIAVSMNLFSSKQLGEKSRLAAPPAGLHEPPGGPASPFFQEQTKKAEHERETTALKTGSSALPTPLGESKPIEEMTAGEKPKDDALNVLREQIKHQTQEIQNLQHQTQQPAQQAQRAPEQFDESLAQAMQKEMQKFMGEWEPKGIKQVSVSKDDEDNGKKSEASGSDSSGGSKSTSATQYKVIVPAGTVSYAQLLIEANSDVPGPILAQIVSGPLTGARAIGEFKVTQDPYLVMRFSLANLKGKDYSIDALALDPDTTLGGMATEVDERWMTRVLLPAAAGFIQGFGSALGQGSSSIVTNGTTTIVQQSGKGIQQGAFQGVAQAGQTLGQFFENQANQTQPLVRVAAGTPMGLFFLSTVVDTVGDQTGAPQETLLGRPGMNRPGGYGGYGQPPGGYYPGMSGYGNQLPPTSTIGANANIPYPGLSTPYPNASMPYNGQALTSPNSNITPYYGSNYPNTTPNTYGIGTPLVNP